MDKELFGIALGIKEPVYIDEIVFDETDGELHIHMNFRRGGRFSCSDCQEPELPVHDTVEKTWRHLNFFQYKCYIHLRTPRTKCPKCGERLWVPPWGRKQSGFDGEHTTVYSRTKQYRKEFAHDGIYAEATLLIHDEEQRTGDDDGDGDNTNAHNRPRKCYLFCEEGNSNRLFEELDKKTAVPLIPEFKDYVLGELQNRGILKQLRVISSREKFDVWAFYLSKDEENVIYVVNAGLKSKAISIPGAVSNEFPAIHSVTGYLNAFGIMIAERIKSQFNPLFDPATEALSKPILAVNDYIKANAGYSLYDAQLAVAEAHKRCLQRKKATLCISECGSGKSKIGITALHAYQQRNNPDTQVKHFNVILCPSHMTKKCTCKTW